MTTESDVVPDGVPPDSVLLGPVSLDRYLAEGLVLPGGGVLNMAYHWRGAGLPFHLLTRIGDDRPAVFLDFLHRYGIPHSADSLVAPGPSASIDIAMGADRQPHMDNFLEGVWSGLRLTVAEEALVAGARRLHVVLVAPVVDELMRLGRAGRLRGVVTSGDFLSFRRWTVERFAAVMEHLDVGFIGWPDAVDHPTLAGVRAAAFARRRLVIVTLGERGVLLFDGRGDSAADRFVPVVAVPVTGTTVGCGDAFIAAFLAAWWRGADLDAALALAAAAGAQATTWIRPLPDAAYPA